jgi:predicted DNA-binding transcriptional regulator AlpA
MLNSSPMIAPELLTAKQAAQLCSMGERTFWRHAHSGVAPAPVRIGGSARYRRADLLRWIDAGCPRIEGGPTNV